MMFTQVNGNFSARVDFERRVASFSLLIVFHELKLKQTNKSSEV